jgi:hypothetical protein
LNTLFLKRPPAPPGDHHIALTFMEFLVLEACPPAWLGLDLYIFRDDEVVFYVGQSERAYERAWNHVIDGYKGRSVIGRFLLCNWPLSLHIIVEFYSARHALFAQVGHSLDAAEKLLIEQGQPCFNVAANPTPTPLPTRYQPPSAPPQHLRRLATLKSIARAYLRAENKRKTLDEINGGLIG